MRHPFMLTLALCLVVAPADSNAQQCTALIWGCSTEAHEATGSGTAIGKPSHSSCNICPGSVFNCHSECNPSFGGLSRAAYIGVLEAAARGEIETVLALAGYLGGQVRYNESRRAVQIFDCSGESVIASLPIASAPVLRVALGFHRNQVASRAGASLRRAGG